MYLQRFIIGFHEIARLVNNLQVVPIVCTTPGHWLDMIDVEMIVAVIS